MTVSEQTAGLDAWWMHEEKNTEVTPGEDLQYATDRKGCTDALRQLLGTAPDVADALRTVATILRARGWRMTADEETVADFYLRWGSRALLRAASDLFPAVEKGV